MIFSRALLVSALAGSTNAIYRCATNRGNTVSVTTDQANAAIERGGATTGKSGFPHDFYGKASGTGAQLIFYGADPRCNEKQTDGTNLFEFPVYGDGRLYDKDSKRDVTDTPARVVYIKSDLTRCGVMTHVIERDDHTGSGDFRVCDDVAAKRFAA
ncbi:rRNA endonuclease [Microdochium nivale]|nr:rRNA endonuclease [Microdochium nivale]